MFKKLVKQHKKDIFKVLSNIDFTEVYSISTIFSANEKNPVSRQLEDSMSLLLFKENKTSVIKLCAERSKIFLYLLDDIDDETSIQFELAREITDEVFLVLAILSKQSVDTYLKEFDFTDISCFLDKASIQEYKIKTAAAELKYELELKNLIKNTSLDYNEHVFSCSIEDMSYLYSSEQPNLKENTIEIHMDFINELGHPIFVGVGLFDKNIQILESNLDEDFKDESFRELDPLSFPSKPEFEMFFTKHLDECLVLWKNKIANSYKNSLI